MRPRMPDCGLRYIMQTISPIDRAPAEIHLFEPQWKKAFVKTAEFLPNRPPNHQKRSSRLLHFHSGIIVQPQSTISTVDGIIRPQAVQQESFQNQSRWRWQLAHHESDLRVAPLVQQPPSRACRARQIARLAKTLQSTN